MIDNRNILLFVLACCVSFVIADIVLGLFMSNSDYCKAYSEAELRDLGPDFTYSDIPNLFFIPNLDSPSFNYLKIKEENNKISENGENNTMIKIFVIGDSITSEEIYVENNRSNLYTSLLEKKLNPGNCSRYDVWNLGVMKYNTLQEYLYFKGYFLKYDPDVVIIGYSEYNDYDPPRLNYNPELSPAQNCILATIPNVLSFKKEKHILLSHSNIYQGINILVYNMLKKSDPIKYPNIFFKDSDSIKMVGLNRKALMNFIELSRQEDFRLIIIIFPVLSNDYERDPWLIDNLDENIYVDSSPFLIAGLGDLEKAKVPDQNDDTLHLNKKAHGLISEILYNKLSENLNLSESDATATGCG